MLQTLKMISTNGKIEDTIKKSSIEIFLLCQNHSYSTSKIQKFYIFVVSKIPIPYVKLICFTNL